MKKFLPIKLLLSFLLLGCGGGSSSTSTDNELNSTTTNNIIGYLIDSAVQGAKYTCAEKTDFTDEEGKFICSNLPVSFYIGELLLGDISILPEDQKVFPQDIVGVDRNNTSHPEVIKLATLLQSLDSDNNASNTITITPQTNQSFENEESNTSLTQTTIADLEEINDNVHQLSTNEVEEHLTTSTNNATLPTGYTFPVINNQNQSIETTLNDYTIKLYANYQESPNPQSIHQGVVIKINNENSERVAIQATYQSKSILAAVYKDGKIIAISDLFTVTNETLLFIEVTI